MQTFETHPDSLLHILKDLRDDSLKLMRQEIELAKREMTNTASAIAKKSALLGAGAVVGLFSFLFVILFLNNLLIAGLQSVGFSPSTATWFAPLLIGMLLAVGALLFTLKGLKSMRIQGLKPEMTMASLREDKDWIKAKVKR